MAEVTVFTPMSNKSKESMAEEEAPPTKVDVDGVGPVTVTVTQGTVFNDLVFVFVFVFVLVWSWSWSLSLSLMSLSWSLIPPPPAVIPPTQYLELEAISTQPRRKSVFV